jgi:energy-coupling factor transporter ATP-binding protein EcfA2
MVNSDTCPPYTTGAPSALNGVSVDIKPGEKIGVCGRESSRNCLCQPLSPCGSLQHLLRTGTGAGKSTLLSVLFSLGPLSGGKVRPPPSAQSMPAAQSPLSDPAPPPSHEPAFAHTPHMDPDLDPEGRLESVLPVESSIRESRSAVQGVPESNRPC